jgi:NADH:ubiquinone reductase (H+-translocating)
MDAIMSAHHVVVVGAGFGGLGTVRGLAGAPVRLTLVDRRNYHLFQPLLYQAATASLAPSEIAWPIRQLFRRRSEVTTLLAAVETIDKASRGLVLDDGSKLAYDTLVLATSARHAYFGHDDWEAFASRLKTLNDATNIRGRILLAFEEAERIGPKEAGGADDLRRRRCRPYGGRIRRHDRGAGARDVAWRLPTHRHAKGPHRSDRSRLPCPAGRGVVFESGKLAAETIIWAAGVQASPAAKWVEAPADRAGRLMVSLDLTVPGHPEIFAIGDAALVLRPDGRPVPGIAPAAKQEGTYVAKGHCHTNSNWPCAIWRSQLGLRQR